MIESSSAAQILNALGLAIFERNTDGTFTLVGKLPSWLDRFGLSQSIDLTREELIDRFALLETFLVEAEEAWCGLPAAPVDSGPWVQSDQIGRAHV